MERRCLMDGWMDGEKMLDEEKMFDEEKIFDGWMDGWMTVIVHWYCTCFDEWSIDLLVQIGHNLYRYVCYVKYT